MNSFRRYAGLVVGLALIIAMGRAAHRFLSPVYLLFVPNHEVPAGSVVPILFQMNRDVSESTQSDSEISEFRVEFEGQSYPLLHSTGVEAEKTEVYQSFIPLALDQSPGETQVRIRVSGLKGAGDVLLERSIRVVRTIAMASEARPIDISNEVFEEIQKSTDRERSEQSEILQLAQGVSPRVRINAPLALPLAEKTLTSDFGETRIFNGKSRSMHMGVDLAGFTGEPVMAAAPGRVELVRELLVTGKTVMIDHGGGVHSLYGHLSGIDVQEGAEVSAGESIGKVGMTGRASGPHLHWGLLVHGKYVDPLSLPLRSRIDGLQAEVWEKRWEELCDYDFGRDGMAWCRWLKRDDGSWVSAKAEILELISILAPEIRNVANLYGVDPRAIAGVILAENSLNLNLSDEIQNFLVSSRILETPKLLGRTFTIGLGQVHLGTAVRVEEFAAHTEHRPVRKEGQISRELLTTRGTLYYIGAILRTAQDIYRDHGFDVSKQPEVLATLYNLGHPDRFAAESKESGRQPRLNFFGFFVSMQMHRIESALRVERSMAAIATRGLGVPSSQK